MVSPSKGKRKVDTMPKV